MKAIAFGALAALTISSAAFADTLYNADLFEGPGVYFGVGNLNGGWTINNDGAELGLRARLYQENTVAPVGNVYTVAGGEDISLDFSAMWAKFDDIEMVTNFTSLLTIQNLTSGGTASFSPELIPDNAHPSPLLTFGGFQNSERFSFGFLNGDPLFNVGDINYNNMAGDSFLVTWVASADQFSPQTVEIQINQGAGNAVPEPGTWALLVLGFGTAGALLRRKGAWA